MKIEYLRIKNYRVLRSIEIRNIPAMAVFLGANGVGKSTLFDVFSFLRDALLHNVRVALAKRGGFREVVSRGETGPIEIELKIRDGQSPLVTYELHISLTNGFPIVERELLKYRRGARGRPWHFLDFKEGKGQAITNEEEYGQENVTEKREEQQLESADILALKGLGQFSRFKQASTLRRLFENWHLSNFHIADARPSQEIGYSEHLSERGENLALVAQFMYEHHRDAFNHVLEKMTQRVPGISHVEAQETVDGRIVLRFQDGAFKDPFIARYVSDGTIKMFAYLLLLHDPSPHPLLAVEEPENQLHPSLLEPLAEEFRDYAERGGQVFISTHSPDFVNGVHINELFWLEKGTNGFTQIYRAGDDQVVKRLVEEGDQLGYLWKQGFLKGSGPE